jgi:hypothetical protein
VKPAQLYREQIVTRRFVSFLKRGPTQLRLPGEEVIARFEKANPDLSPEFIRGTAAVTSFAPEMYGD